MVHKNNPFKGTWKIIWMELWAQEYINMEVSAHVTINNQGKGEFQFGLVQGNFKVDFGQTYFDSEWVGCDEMDDVSGEIYATFEEEELRGSISFHKGDESEFRAVKK